MLIAVLTTLIGLHCEQDGKGAGHRNNPACTTGGGGAGDITCTEGQQATGDSSKIGTGTALLGAIACTDPDAVAYRRTLPESVAGPTVSGGTTDGLATVNIYGPFEAGFTNAQPGMSCLGTNTVAGGIDTSTAELVIQYFCSDATLKIIDTCGDHANPRHFHEYLTDCLTSRTSGGSSRLGTAADGRGIYGKYGPGDTLPVLDACGATNAPTPDSGGASVVHYHAQTGRPFFLGCYTNADASTTLDQCRAFYAACGQAADIVTITTVHGSGQYNKWCPCFDTLTQSNVKAGAAPYYTRPAFLEAVAAATSSPSPQPSPPPLSSPPLPQPPSPPAASSSLSAAPNFLLIQPDDLPFHWPEHAPLAPPDMGATPALALPNIARLAAEGATFSRAYASSPMCAPSRYGLLTGRHPSRGTYAQQSTIDNCGAGSTVTDVVVPKTKLDLDLDSNVQTLLRDGGYRTGVTLALTLTPTHTLA